MFTVPVQRSGRRDVARQRAATILLLLAAAIGFFNAGMTWMTHMYHDGLRHVAPDRMAAYDVSYEALTSALLVPLNAASILCVLAMFALRHRGVPWWMLGVAAALQATVWTVRMTLWGPLADETRAAGWAARDGVLEPSYEEYMSTSWLRIALLTAYAVLVLSMLVMSLVRAPSVARPAASLAAWQHGRCAAWRPPSACWPRRSPSLCWRRASGPWTSAGWRCCWSSARRLPSGSARP